MKKLLSVLVLSFLTSSVLALGLNLNATNRWDDMIKIKEGVFNPFEDNIMPGQTVRHYMFMINNFRALYATRSGMWAEIPGCNISSTTKDTTVTITYSDTSPFIPKCIITH